MQWSRYSTLFESKRNGWLLFNTISRSLMVVKPEQLDTIRGIMADPEGYDYSRAVKLYMQLRAMGFLVEDGKDDEFYNIHKIPQRLHIPFGKIFFGYGLFYQF